MSQNRIDSTLPAAARDEILAAIQAIRTRLPFLVDIAPEERQGLPKFGDKSVAFVHRALEVARQNPDILPRRFDLDAYGRDVALLDAMEPVRLALSRLAEHVEDTRFLVGSEAYLASLEVYRQVKESPTGLALDETADELGKRFARRGSAAPAPAPAPTP